MKENIRNDFVRVSILFPICKIFITRAATSLKEFFCHIFTMVFFENKF